MTSHLASPSASAAPSSLTARPRARRRRLPLLLAATALAALPARLAAREDAGAPRNATGALLAAPLTSPLRTLKVATLDLPQPLGTMPPAPQAGVPDELPAKASSKAQAPQDIAPPDPSGPAWHEAMLPSAAERTTGTGKEPETESAAPAAMPADREFQYPPPLVLGPHAAPSESTSAETATAPAAAQPVDPRLELALDLLLELPVIQDGGPEPDNLADATADTPFDFDGQEAASLVLPAPLDAAEGTDPDAPQDMLKDASPGAGQEASQDASRAATHDPAETPAQDAPAAENAARPQGAPRHDAATVFGSDPRLFPPLAFEYNTLADRGFVPQPLQPPAPAPPLQPAVAEREAPAPDGIWPSPAARLNLTGPALARAQKCLAEAIYFESRGEPKRGQIAVAQVVVNRVFSGYYPADVCGTVYQNAQRHLACQFTFACDNVKDVIREPDMWVQAKEIAADMLDGKLWLTSVGRATHYHAYWVHPSWVREMQKLDRIGVHTFYRPRRWQS